MRVSMEKQASFDEGVAKAREIFLSFSKKTINMDGPNTDELVQSGKIRTPYPDLISSRNFPLVSRSQQEMLVFIPLSLGEGTKDIFTLPNRYCLSDPTHEHAIRFASQFVIPTGANAEKDQTTFFLNQEPLEIAGSGAQRWLTHIWRSGKQKAELCLYRIFGRSIWPENSRIAGVVDFTKIG